METTQPSTATSVNVSVHGHRWHQLSLAGVCVHISTDYSPWERYLQQHFGPVLQEATSAQPEVIVTAGWQHLWRGAPMRAERSSRFPDRVGSSIVRSHREICRVQKFGGRRFRLIAGWDGDQLLLEGLYQKKVIKDRVKVWMGDSEAQRLFELTYPLVYYPLWYYLEAHGQRHVLHASAVQHAEGAIVFAGLEGIGKSTLALACAARGNGLISDNLLWYSDRDVLGVPEPIRLHGDHPMPSGLPMQPLSIGSAQKGFYRTPVTVDAPVTPAAVLLPMFGSQTEIVPLAAEQCADFLLAANQLTGEVGGYRPFAAWMNLLQAIPDVDAMRRQRLIALLGTARCGVLRMQRDGQVDRVVSLVYSWVEQRATSGA